MSIATLLSQHHQVTAVDIVPEKVELINNRKSPIQDDYIEKYLAEKELNLTATLDAKAAYADADFVVIAAPTNYDSQFTLFSVLIHTVIVIDTVGHIRAFLDFSHQNTFSNAVYGPRRDKISIALVNFNFLQVLIQCSSFNSFPKNFLGRSCPMQ